MKIQGKTNVAPSNLQLPLPRIDENGEEYFIVFEAQMITDFTKFNALCPMPKPPVQSDKHGTKIELVMDERFLKAQDDWATKKFSWTVLRSLEATKDLEWTTIKKNDASTWNNYRQELEDAGFRPAEVNKIVSMVIDANIITDEKLAEARMRFLALRAAQDKK